MAMSNWIGYDPFLDVRNIHSQVGDVFDGFFNDRQVSQGKGGQRNKSLWLPVVDVKENDQGFTIHAELPGMKKEDINLDVNDGILTLSGEKKDEKKEENERFHRYVFSTCPFIYHINLSVVIILQFLTIFIFTFITLACISYTFTKDGREGKKKGKKREERRVVVSDDK
jgi:HSP20 family molecular chaperone IbpA